MMVSSGKNDTACGKMYNIEWYLGSGRLQISSAMLECIGDGYFYFEYPNGGLFIIEQRAVRSLECVEKQ